MTNSNLKQVTKLELNKDGYMICLYHCWYVYEDEQSFV